jgi:hypothetical protein
MQNILSDLIVPELTCNGYKKSVDSDADSQYMIRVRTVRSVDSRWIHLWPDILKLVEGLKRLGFECCNGQVHYAGLEDDNA